MTALIKPSPPMDIEVGRDIYVTRHPFADPEKVWFNQSVPLHEMVSEVFPQDDLAARAIVLLDGAVIDRNDWAIMPPPRSRIEILIPVQKGLLRWYIRQMVVMATFAVTFVLSGGNVGLAMQVAATVGNYLGGLLANALVPPSLPDSNRLDTPTLYSIEAARNTARIGQPVPIILGTRRMVGDLVVPFYQEISGEDIYIRGAVCWGYGDYQLADLKNGDTPLSNFEGVQIQHSLKQTDPTPTLIPGIPSPLAVGADLVDNNWASRTTAPDAEEVEILLAFPQGLGWLKKGETKRAHSVELEVRYRETGSGAWRTTSAANTQQADQVAVDLGSINRRYLLADLGGNFIDSFHNELDSGAAAGGSVSLTRTFTRSAPGEAFFTSFKFAVPPGKQYDIEVRRKSPVQSDDLYFEDVTWTTMNTWRDGNPFPNPLAAVTAIRVKATEELSGVLDTINAVVSNLVRSYSPPADGPDAATSANFTGATASSNGADQLLHICLGPHQSRPTPEAEINWPKFAAFWEWCDNNNFTFDFVETSGRRKGDLQQLVGSACRARIMRIDGLLTPVIDGPKPEGPRTILSPDNATQFTFNKIFAPDVHALRVEFPNKINGFRNDERIIYLNGHDAATATNFEKFALPGVVDPDLIFNHAQYFDRSARLQTLSGSCVQDIEGSMILRYGDRVAVRHSTVQVTGESGWVEQVFTNTAGQITGFQLSEPAKLTNGASFVFRWRKISEDAQGQATVSAAHLENIIFDTNGADQIETNSFTFATPLSPTSGFKVGILGVVGILGQDTIDALVRGVEPTDDSGQYFRIFWTLYAPDRFDAVTVPPHIPLTPPTLNARPAPPTLLPASANNEGIFIGFEITPVAGAAITGFEVWTRETPAAGADTPWHPQANLPPLARAIVLPPGRPGQSFDVRLVALGAGDTRSDPVIGTGYLSYSNVSAPENPNAVPTFRAVSGGASVPVIAVSADVPDDVALSAQLVVEMKLSSGSAWTIATTAPADNPTKDITAIAPGETYDIRLAWRNARGAITAVSDRPVIANISTGQLTATDTALVAGTPANDIDDGSARARAGLTGVGDVARAIPGTIDIGSTPASTIEAGATRANTGLAANGDVARPIPGTVDIGSTPASTVEAGATRANTGLAANGDVARAIPGTVDIGSTPASTIEAGATRANAGLSANGDVARPIPDTINIGSMAASTINSELQAIVSGGREVGDIIIAGMGSVKSILTSQSTNINTALADAAAASGELSVTASEVSVLASVENGAAGTTPGVTVTVSGGTAPYTFSWTHASGDAGVSVDNSSKTVSAAPFESTTTATGTPGLNATISAIKTCTVTDSTGGTAKTKTINVSFAITDITDFGGGGGGLEP